MLVKAISLGQEHLKISTNESIIIKQCRKSILFDSKVVWLKKEGMFDVTLGCFDGS